MGMMEEDGVGVSVQFDLDHTHPAIEPFIDTDSMMQQ